MARTTSPEKVALIEREGGRCHLVDDAAEVYDVARRLADELGGHYLDQFTFAERATDWRGNNNIAESVFEQMGRERHPVPTWVVVGAGTGGTSATIGRYVRYRSLATQVCVVDPENSAFLPAFRGDQDGVAHACGSRIEGIGRPRVEPSFVPAVVDRMLLVPDVASVAAMRFLADRTGLRAGCSTGTNLYGALRLACEMAARGEHGSIVSLLCDGADRYAGTYLSDGWVAERGWDLQGPTATLRRAWDEGVWDEA
jgi:cysteine synthase A